MRLETSNTKLQPIITETSKNCSSSFYTLDSKGAITDLEKTIIQILYELHIATADTIRLAFLHPDIPSTQKFMILSGSRNPYRKSIRHLCFLHLIEPYALFDGDKQTSPRFYILTEKSFSWILEQASFKKLLYWTSYPVQQFPDHYAAYKELVLKHTLSIAYTSYFHVTLYRQYLSSFQIAEPLNLSGFPSTGIRYTIGTLSLILVPALSAESDGCFNLACIPDHIIRYPDTLDASIPLVLLIVQDIFSAEQIRKQYIAGNQIWAPSWFISIHSMLQSEEKNHFVIHYPDTKSSDLYEICSLQSCLHIYTQLFKK